MTQVAIVVTDTERATRAIASMREGYEGPIDLFVIPPPSSRDQLSIESLRTLGVSMTTTGLERIHRVSASDAHLQALDDGDDDLMIFADDVVVMVDWKGALDELIDQAQLDLGRAPLVALSAGARPDLLVRDSNVPYVRLEKPVVSLDVHGLFVPAEHREALAAMLIFAAPGEAFGDVVRRYVSETEGAELVVTMPEIILVMMTT